MQKPDNASFDFNQSLLLTARVPIVMKPTVYMRDKVIRSDDPVSNIEQCIQLTLRFTSSLFALGRCWAIQWQQIERERMEDRVIYIYVYIYEICVVYVCIYV